MRNSNIRRVDELGRIVIPKDIRKKLRIRDNEPLEIFIDNDEIHIKKYSQLPDILTYIEYLINIASRITQNDYIVTDRDNIISGTNKTIVGHEIATQVQKIVLSGNSIKNQYVDIDVTNKFNLKGFVNTLSLLIENDRVGLIIEYNSNKKVENFDMIKMLKSLIENKIDTN